MPREEKDISVSDVQLILGGEVNKEDIVLKQDNESHSFTKSLEIGDVQSFVIRDKNLELNDWKLEISNITKEIDLGFLVIRMLLK